MYAFLDHPRFSSMMLSRIAIRRGPLRQVSDAVQHRPTLPFTTLARTGATTHPVRQTAAQHGEAVSVSRPRATMSSASTEPSRTRTYLDDGFKKPGVKLDCIKSRMTCTKFHDSVWGFVIYRCSPDHQAAWHLLLQNLRSDVEDSLRYCIGEDLIKFHDLHVIDDKSLYGASSHQVRDHFRSWVPKNLEDRLRPDATDLQDDMGWIRATCTPRYEYCLLADDICLESVEHARLGNMKLNSVVKILHKDWECPYPPEERNYTVPEPFHDGATEYLEEDVGWMYMPVISYLDKYDLLEGFSSSSDWDSQYVRPPYIYGLEDENTFVGHWRRQLKSEAA